MNKHKKSTMNAIKKKQGVEPPLRTTQFTLQAVTELVQNAKVNRYDKVVANFAFYIYQNEKKMVRICLYTKVCDPLS